MEGSAVHCHCPLSLLRRRSVVHCVLAEKLSQNAVLVLLSDLFLRERTDATIEHQLSHLDFFGISSAHWPIVSNLYMVGVEWSYSRLLYSSIVVTTSSGIPRKIRRTLLVMLVILKIKTNRKKTWNTHTLTPFLSPEPPWAD